MVVGEGSEGGADNNFYDVLDELVYVLDEASWITLKNFGLALEITFLKLNTDKFPGLFMIYKMRLRIL